MLAYSDLINLSTAPRFTVVAIYSGLHYFPNKTITASCKSSTFVIPCFLLPSLIHLLHHIFTLSVQIFQVFFFQMAKSQKKEKKHNCSKSVFIFYSRLHGRYHELAPHLVPMDYTNEPDCKLPLALIVNMPELKVKEIVACKLFPNASASFYPYVIFHQQRAPVLCFLILDRAVRTL